MLPGVFNLIAVALVPLTAYVVNGEPGPTPPAYGNPDVLQKREWRGPPGREWRGPPGREWRGPPGREWRGPPGREWRGPPGREWGPPGPPEFRHHEPEFRGPEWHHKRDWQPMEVTRGFQTCQSQVSNYGPRFETACQNNHPEVLVNGLIDIRTSIVSLSAQVHASVGAWATAEVHTCADNYVGLLVKIQALLLIIHTHDRVDSCRDSILGLNVPLQGLVSAFVNARVDVGLLLGARVNLGLLSSVGISLGISANVAV